MAMNIGRKQIFALLLIAGIVALGTGARGAVELTTGIRYVVPTGSLQDCGVKAKAALNTYLQDAAELHDGSGDWSAQGPLVGAAGTASAVVHCTALAKGYVVTFTCAVQKPASLYGASDLCLDVAHQFSGKPTVALATPTPLPTGCSTVNLVGTWVSDDDRSKTFVMTVDNSLTGSDDVSGSWYLTGTTATLTYYGDHVTTLSADGKHLVGGGYHLTRKC